MQYNNFKGFSPKALEFLKNIRLNNSKLWYEENKPLYKKLLFQPFQDLVSDLSSCMLEIDPQIITIPKVDKTISRIYRDLRFSKDKSLYRDSMWLTFKRYGIDWKESPSYFFEITPTIYRYGMGFYYAPKSYMDKFRERIAAKPDEFLESIKPFESQKIFTIEGDCYKRPPKFEKINPKIANWLQYKSFYITSNHQIGETLFSEQLTRDLIAGFQNLAPFYNYLWNLKL